MARHSLAKESGGHAEGIGDCLKTRESENSRCQIPGDGARNTEPLAVANGC
jgi:hypothetical protein